MDSTKLQTKSKSEVLDFIRQRLRFDPKIKDSIREIDSSLLDKQHKRFDMSGYETKTGECTVWNMSIVNEFADLGIYDYTNYLFLDFYKGTPTLYLQYFQEVENIVIDDLSGYGTTEIIYRIFELTIFSDRGRRRRI